MGNHCLKQAKSDDEINFAPFTPRVVETMMPVRPRKIALKNATLLT